MANLIVHIVYSFRVGGLENGVVNLINRLPAQSYRHAIVSLTDIDPTFFSRITQPNVQCFELHKSPGSGAKLYPKVFRLIKKLNPAIVHTRNLAALEMSIPAWAAGVPHRVHGEHGRDVDDPHGTSRKQQWIRRAYRPFVSHYIALSRELNDYLGEKVGVPQARRSLICNGVDAQRFAPAANRQRAEVAGSPFNAPELFVFGSVGRVQAVKNHIGLIHAFAKMRAALGEAAAHTRLVIVGEGPLLGELKNVAQQRGVAPWVWLPGERADISEQMRGMDCFALPSLAEGISNTILEAMACALPVIASAVGGSPELVLPESTGTLVPAQDDEALAQAMARYITEPDLCAKQGTAARARIEAQFSLDAMVDHYDKVYQSLLNKR